jgi:hypothetical protein
MLKRTLEHKPDGVFFSEDQIDSIQLLYANFRVAHLIEPSMKAFAKGIQTKDFAEASRIIHSNDKIASVVLPTGAGEPRDRARIRQVVQYLLLKYEPSSISDLSTWSLCEIY